MSERAEVSMSNQSTVVDNSEASRFELLVDGEVAGFAEYRRRTPSSPVSVLRTVVQPEFEGRGLGSQLARGALDAIRDGGDSVLPFCPFIQRFIQRRPAYLGLVPADRRAEFQLPDSAEPDQT